MRWSDDATRIATLTRRDSQNVILILDAAGTELMSVRPRHTVYDTSLSRHTVYDTSGFRPSFDWTARGTGIMYNALNRSKRRPEVWFIVYEALGAPSSWNTSVHHAAYDGYELISPTMEGWLHAEVARVARALG